MSDETLSIADYERVINHQQATIAQLERVLGHIDALNARIADLAAQQTDSAAAPQWTSEEAEEWRIEAVHFRDRCIEYEHRIRELEQATAQAVAMPVEAPEALRYILMRYSQEHSGEDHQRRVREAKDWLQATAQAGE